jgi:hypothetical protein
MNFQNIPQCDFVVRFFPKQLNLEIQFCPWNRFLLPNYCYIVILCHASSPLLKFLDEERFPKSKRRAGGQAG